MTSDDPIKWLRPLKTMEKFDEMYQKANTLLTAYRISLASSQLISEEVFRTALRHLNRKVINLRLVIRENPEDGQLWFCERNDEKIDFEIINNENIDEAFAKIPFESYDSYNGPLWRAKLQYEPNQPCYLPELQDKYPHQYTFLIGTHHGTTDGTSKHTTLGLFFTILNDVIAGKDINDQPFGHLSDGAETEALIRLRKDQFEKDPEIRNQLQSEIAGLSKMECHLQQLTEPQDDTNPRSLHVFRTIEPDLNKQLYEKFKSVGVTFNSGFFSLVNIVLVDMLKEKNINQSEYELGSMHLINNRKYWRSETRNLALGNHTSFITLAMRTPSDVKSDIVTYMKDFHAKLSSFVANKRSIDESILTHVTNKSEDEIESELENAFEPLYSYYTGSNMTDVTQLIGTGGDHVQLTWFTRSTSITHLPYPVTFMLHSFRGRLIIGIDYTTKFVSLNFINDLIDRTIDLCKTFVK